MRQSNLIVDGFAGGGGASTGIEIELVMIYNDKPDIRLRHFARWVNSRICTTCDFKDYYPWQQAQEAYYQYTLNF